MEKTKNKLRKHITIFLILFSILLSFLGGIYLFYTIDFSSNPNSILKENFNIWFILIIYIILSEMIFISFTFSEYNLSNYSRTDWKLLKFLGFFLSIIFIILITTIIRFIEYLIKHVTLEQFTLILKIILIGIIVLGIIYISCKGNKRLYNYIADKFFK